MKQLTTNDIISYKVESDFSGTNPEYTYTVDWGDGAIDSTVGGKVHYIAHCYSQAGKYDPALTVLDNKKGCWKTFDLDTVYVLGVNLVVNISTDDHAPVFSATINGSYDIDAGNGLDIQSKWYFGDGEEDGLNYWSTTQVLESQPYVITANPPHTYVTDGTYTGWVAIKVMDSEFSYLKDRVEVSNCTMLTIPFSITQGAAAKIVGSSTSESTTQLYFYVDAGSGPFTAEVDWGDGSTSTYDNIPLLTKFTLQHSFPSTSGSTIYSPVIIVTDSAGNTSTLKYSLYIVPTVTLTPQFAGACVATGIIQLSVIHAGNSPYAAYFDLAIRHSAEAGEVPRCRVKIVTDTTVDSASTTYYFPNNYSWYGPGAQMFSVSGIVRDFTIELDHNFGADSYNSMLLRAYVIDSSGKVSEKVNLVRCGISNIENVGV